MLVNVCLWFQRDVGPGGAEWEPWLWLCGLEHGRRTSSCSTRTVSSQPQTFPSTSCKFHSSRSEHSCLYIISDLCTSSHGLLGDKSTAHIYTRLTTHQEKKEMKEGYIFSNNKRVEKPIGRKSWKSWKKVGLLEWMEKYRKNTLFSLGLCSTYMYLNATVLSIFPKPRPLKRLRKSHQFRILTRVPTTSLKSQRPSHYYYCYY